MIKPAENSKGVADCYKTSKLKERRKKKSTLAGQ